MIARGSVRRCQVRRSDVDLAGHARDRPAADPDRAVGVVRDVDPARAAEHRALARDVRRACAGRSAAATARARRSGCRSPGPRRSPPSSGRTRAPRTPPPRPPGTGRPRRRRRSTTPGPQRQHRLGAREQHARPSRGRCRPTAASTIVVARDAEHRGQVLDQRARPTGPDRSSGGAANASRGSPAAPAPGRRRTPGRRRRRRRGAPPASSQAWHVPSVGWPANGSSRLGVKMRTR